MSNKKDSHHVCESFHYFAGPRLDLLITWFITSEKTSPTAMAPDIIEAFAARDKAVL